VPLAVVAAIGPSLSAPVLAARIQIDDFVVSTPISHAQRDATVRAADNLTLLQKMGIAKVGS
jgi:hypothetical protein